MAKLFEVKEHGTWDEPDVMQGACWVCKQDIKTMIRKGGKFCSEKCEKQYERENL